MEGKKESVDGNKRPLTERKGDHHVRCGFFVVDKMFLRFNRRKKGFGKKRKYHHLAKISISTMGIAE